MQLVEEFMLAANEAVAEKLHTAGVGALYRIHEQPDPERVREFAELVASFGYRIPGDLEAVRPGGLPGASCARSRASRRRSSSPTCCCAR